MDKVELTLHQRVVLCYTLGTDRPENVDKNKEFFPFHPKHDISKDETDTVELDLDDIVQTLSAVNIEQRQPQLKVIHDSQKCNFTLRRARLPGAMILGGKVISSPFPKLSIGCPYFWPTCSGA